MTATELQGVVLMGIFLPYLGGLMVSYMFDLYDEAKNESDSSMAAERT